MRYGFVGLGNMGGHLAASLIRAGFDVVVYDRKPDASRRHGAMGAVVAASLVDLAGQVDHVFTCLPDPHASEAVLAQLLPFLPEGANWIECSTLGRDDVLRLAHFASDQGVRMLEAPVTGGVHLAARGEITIFLGGEADLLALHRPALQAMGGRLIHIGPLGAAAVMKVISNMLAFVHLLAEGEALMLASRGGLDLRTVYEAIGASAGNSFVHENEAQLILNGSYDGRFTMDFALRDLGFALEFAREAGVPLDLAAQVQQAFVRGRAAFGGDAPSTQVVKLLEDLLQTPLRSEGFPDRL